MIEVIYYTILFILGYFMATVIWLICDFFDGWIQSWSDRLLVPLFLTICGSILAISVKFVIFPVLKALYNFTMYWSNI